MIIDFTAKNFRSIKEKQTFSMEAVSSIKELPHNSVKIGKVKLLKSAIIYGRNASGKSNILKAFRALEFLVTHSNEFKVGEDIPPYEPYKLDTETINQPVEFEINFFGKDNLKYNYSLKFVEKNILEEVLTYYPNNYPIELFNRKKGKPLKVSKLIDSNYKEVEKGLYPNQLFLSKISTVKIKVLVEPYESLTRHLFVQVDHNSRVDDALIRLHSQLIAGKRGKIIQENLNNLLEVADTGIKGIKAVGLKEENFKFPKDIPKDLKDKFISDNKYRLRVKHDLFNKGKVIKEIEFDIDEESTGTKKMLAYGGIMLEALNDGDTFIVDELDKSLHPLLTKALINLFNNPKTNPKNAQLIFASHDISLLSGQIFRRDQIWFSEKNNNGNSSYYALGNIKGVRKGIDYRKYYSLGAFGAIPVINDHALNFKFTDEK